MEFNPILIDMADFAPEVTLERGKLLFLILSTKSINACLEWIKMLHVNWNSTLLIHKVRGSAGDTIYKAQFFLNLFLRIYDCCIKGIDINGGPISEDLLY